MKPSKFFVAALTLGICLIGGASILAQNSPAINPGGQGLDVNAILQALGLGGTLLNPGGTPGIGTGTGTGTPTTQPGDGGGVGDGERAPTIVSNQFTTTGSQALRDRSPGRYTRQAIGVQTGEVTLTGDFVDEPGFGGQLTTDISNIVLNTWSDIFAGINTFLGALGGFGGTDGTGTTTVGTIPNSATTGQGTTTEIERAISN